MVKFMMSEDWSRRMPEFREYINSVDKHRGLDFKTVFPEMADLLDESMDSAVATEQGETIDEKLIKELGDGGTI